MQLINTEIVHPRTDIFWQQPPEMQTATPRPVLVVTTAFNNQAEEEQLTGILQTGCKLNVAQYQLIQLPAGGQLPWYRLKASLQPRVVLLFHIYPAQLGVSALFRFSEVNKFDGALWIPAAPLGQLISDKALKGQLWNNALKPVFENQAYGNMLQ
jgi:hypothetical protein